MLVHLLRVEIGDEKADVIALYQTNKIEGWILANGQSNQLYDNILNDWTKWGLYLNWFSPENKEVLGSHHHESHKLLTQDLLNLISLRRRQDTESVSYTHTNSPSLRK